MKQILLLIFFIIFTISLSAQRVYLGVHAGYGFATSAGQFEAFDIKETEDEITYQKVKGGLGAGTNAGLRFGININRFFAFELGASYLSGRTITYEYELNAPFVYEKEITSFSTEMFQLSPQIVFKIPASKQLMPYAKIGATFGLNTLVSKNIDYTGSSPTIDDRNLLSEQVFTGNQPVGITASVGINYKIAEKVALIIEFNSLNMNYEPEISTYNKYFLNGNERVNDLTTSAREAVYSDSFTDTKPALENVPQRLPSISMPFSNVAFNMGLRFRL